MFDDHVTCIYHCTHVLNMEGAVMLFNSRMLDSCLPVPLYILIKSKQVICVNGTFSTAENLLLLCVLKCCLSLCNKRFLLIFRKRGINQCFVSCCIIRIAYMYVVPCHVFSADLHQFILVMKSSYAH